MPVWLSIMTSSIPCMFFHRWETLTGATPVQLLIMTTSILCMYFRRWETFAGATPVQLSWSPPSSPRTSSGEKHSGVQPSWSSSFCTCTSSGAIQMVFITSSIFSVYLLRWEILSCVVSGQTSWLCVPSQVRNTLMCSIWTDFMTLCTSSGEKYSHV